MATTPSWIEPYCTRCCKGKHKCDCDYDYCEHDMRVHKDDARRNQVLNPLYREHGFPLFCICGGRVGQPRSAPEKKSPDLGEEDRPGRWYFITFTQPDTDKTVEGLIKSTRKVLKSKMVSPHQWCYSLELTEKGTPHSHIRLFTDKYPEYKKIGAFNRGYRYEVQHEKMSCGNYIIKEESKPTPELLATWGLDSWFFCSDNYSGPRPGPAIVELNSPA